MVVNLKILWAPWRIKYILQPKDEGCFLCKAFKEENDAENLVVYRGEKAFVVMNKYPYNNGHLLIAPYRHVPDIVDLHDDEMLEIMALTRLMVKTLRNVLKPDGFNIGLNLGRASGAGLEDHIHFHVVPRWIGDTNFMPVISETKVIPESLADTYRKILEGLKEVIK